jgi:hypothetical protein
MFSRWFKGVAVMGISAAILMGCAVEVEEGSGVPTTQKRTVTTAFDEIDIRGVGARIVIDPNATQEASAGGGEIELRGDDNLVPGVLTYVEGRRLVVDVGDRDVDSNAGLGVVLKMRGITRVKAERGANVDVTLTTGDNKMGPALAINAKSGAKVTARGTISRLDAELTGGAELHARELIAQDVSLDASGSSTASVCAIGSLDADIGGSAEASYYCDPDHVTREVSGGGRLRQR